MKKFAIASIVLLLSGCALTFHPAEYPLTADRINDFDTSGPVTVANAMHDGSPVTIFHNSSNGISWSGSLEEISQALSSQVQEEVNRHAHSSVTRNKGLTVSVLKFNTTPSTFVLHTEVDVKVEGDGGFQKTIHVEDGTNGSIGGDILRTFNGAIAICTIKILSDPDVLSYLKQA
jgi:hypothetical protein